MILLFLSSCSTKHESEIMGSWCQCLHDGTYKEFKISEDYITTSVSNFINNDWDDGISFYKCRIADSLLIITAGINVDLLRTPEIIGFKSLSSDRMLIASHGESSELTRLEYEIPPIDSTKFELWQKDYLNAFLERANQANCPDLRTDEEKYLPDLGKIEDGFEPISLPSDSVVKMND